MSAFFVIVSIFLLVALQIILADTSGNDTIVVPRVGSDSSTAVDVSEFYQPDHFTNPVIERMNRLYIELAAKKYDDPMILNMEFRRDDRCEMNPDEASMMCCFNTSDPVSYNYAGPDQNFMGWHDVAIKGFRANARAIIEAGKEKPIFDKVAWTGNVLSPNIIVMEHFTRPKLLNFTAKYPHLFHFYHVNPSDNMAREKHFLSQPDMVRKFAYLLDIGGNGWSGRLKWLLFSHRPLLVVDRPYQDYFHRDLQPYVHFIPVKRDLSDLVSQTLWAKGHPKECAMIAENAFRFAVEQFREEKLIERVYEVYKYIKAHHPDRIAHPVPVSVPHPVGRVVRNSPYHHLPKSLPPPSPEPPQPAVTTNNPAPPQITVSTADHPPVRPTLGGINRSPQHPTSQNRGAHHKPQPGGGH